MKEKEVKKQKEQQKEKMFDVKVNKKALEKFMARFFWYAVAIISVLSFVLFIMSAINLYETFAEIAETLYNAWALVRTPLFTNILCVAWFWIVYVFIKSIRE